MSRLRRRPFRLPTLLRPPQNRLLEIWIVFFGRRLRSSLLRTFARFECRIWNWNENCRFTFFMTRRVGVFDLRSDGREGVEESRRYGASASVFHPRRSVGIVQGVERLWRRSAVSAERERLCGAVLRAVPLGYSTFR